MLPPRRHEVTWPDLSRRKAIFAGLTGLLFFPFSRRSGDLDKNFRKEVIRPPGSVAEPEFLERCIKCDQCLRVCPTNVLQPAMFEPGLEGIWTPIMNMRMGYCELNCVLCGQVCPTGAIQSISISQKLGTAPGSAGARLSSGGDGLLRPGTLSPLGNGYPLRGLRGSLSDIPEGHLLAQG